MNRETFTIWITGLSGSGKTTIAKRLKNELELEIGRIQIIDGDTIRDTMGGIFGYSKDERIKAASTYRTMAKLLNDNGINVIVAAITPYEEIRLENRKHIKNYFEVSLTTPLNICIERDVKGLYDKALSGEEKNVIGIDLEYEKPMYSDIYMDTNLNNIGESIDIIKESFINKYNKIVNDRFKNYINKEYWNNIYRNEEISKESLFAQYVYRNLLKDSLDNKRLIDIGCGLGRDSLYFSNNGYDVVGIDGSDIAIKRLKDRETKNLKFENINLLDLDHLNYFFESTNIEDRVNIFYMRFLLHAISLDAEKILFNSIFNNSKKGDYIALEFRTLEDRNISKVYDNHYRRYINEKRILEILNKNNFNNIISFKKGQGLSPYKTEDPYLARIIAQK